MALVLNPLADAQLVLCGSQKLGLLLGVDTALVQSASVQTDNGDRGQPTSYNTRSTLPCCVAVAVSVRIALGWRAKEAPAVRRGPARAERREEAGRASRETERRNTIVCDDETSVGWLEEHEAVYIQEDTVRGPDATQISGQFGRRVRGGSVPLAVVCDVNEKELP